MNEELPSPPDAGRDEPVEARIVSWVLGEASAFEAAELERLCEERPELLIFRHRMRELHGLLTEAETGEPDLSWRLPAEKRRILDEIFGVEATAPTVVPSETRRATRNGLKTVFAIAACVAVSLFVLRLELWDDKAEIRIQVRPQMMAMTMFGGVASGSFPGENSTAVFATEFDRIKSGKLLGKVVDKLDLASRWKMDKDAAIRHLRDITVTENRRGTAQIKIKVRDSKWSNAKEIALEIARTYRDYRAEIDAREVVKGLAELDKSIREQEDTVEDNRKLLVTISKSKGTVGDDEGNPASTALQTYNQLREDKMRLESQINSLQEMDSEQFMATAAGLDVPENVVKSIYPQYMEARRGLESLKVSGLGPDHPEVKAADELAKGMRMRMEEGVATLRESLRTKLHMAEDRLKSVEAQNVRIRVDSIKRGPAGQDYVDAKQMWESSLQVLESLKLKKLGVEMSLQMGHESVFIEEEPRMPARSEKPGSTSFPITPAELAKNRDQNLMQSARQQQIARQSVSQPPAASAVPSNLPLPEIADSQRMESVPAAPFADSASTGLAYTPSARNHESGMVSPEGSLENLASDTADSFASEEKALSASVPPVLASRQSAAPAAPIFPKESIAPEGKAAAPGVTQGDLATLKRKHGMDTTHPQLHGEQESKGELAVGADDVRPAGSAPPSEADPSSSPVMEEVPAAQNPYSTFSLNISDASFQLAMEALAKGERPDPAVIKREQFYNAVDYGDAAPSVDEPIAATIEQAAHPVIPGRNLVRVAVRTGSSGRGASQPLRLTLLVDQSGSMVRKDRRAAMERALDQLGALLTKADVVSVIGFSGTPHLLADGVTGDHAAELGTLVKQTNSEDGMDLEEAMKLGARLAIRHQLTGAQNRVVLFTDGAANLGDAKPERLAEQVKELRQKGIAFDIAGIGTDGLNNRLLRELARNGNGRCHIVDNDSDGFARQLAGAFRPAAENVKIQVIFNPQRVGRYKLIGFEKDRLKMEGFRNDSVDAAELPADKAGVAIYQVEPLAEGRGEIGEVSVRFRDTRSGEMIERSWTVPYESQTIAFDRSAPSMQLAGLSLLAAEKLRDGPLADAIDFKQLSNAAAHVKQFYGNVPRVGEMLQIIEKLK